MKRVLKSSLLVATLSTSLLAVDINKEDTYEYSYFGVGTETFSYSESGYLNSYSFNFKSKSKTKSPVYKSGTVLNFAKKFVVSLDFVSTLTSSETTENWHSADGAFLQDNKSRMGTNSARILYHYLLNNNSRAVTGIHYILNSFRRYGFADNRDIMSEELSNALMFNIGYWYESKKAAQGGFRYMGNIIYGMPVYQNTTNSQYTEVTFNDTDGYNIDATIYGGYTIFKGMEIGVYLSYNYMERDGGRKYLGVDENKDGVEDSILWPKNESEIYRFGLQAVWNFN